MAKISASDSKYTYDDSVDGETSQLTKPAAIDPEVWKKARDTIHTHVNEFGKFVY